ncbi:hypothetical protein JCM10212_002924 [Sporobolomyces blumeae]
MDFANGFQEDDAPVLAPHSAAAAAAPPPPQPSSAARSTSSHVDALDLTDDSPPSTPNRVPGSTRPRPAKGEVKPGVGNGLGSSAHPAKDASNAAKSAGGFGGYAAGAGKAFVDAERAQNGSSGSHSTGSSTPTGQSLGFAKFAPSGQSSTNSKVSPGAATAHSAPQSFASASAASTSFGRVPVISSGATARLPSAYIPYASPSLGSTNVKTEKIGAVKAESSSSSSVKQEGIKPEPVDRKPFKGKGREVVDLTESNSDDEVIVQEPEPVCIGQLETFALVMHQAEEILPPRPVPANAPDGRAWDFDELSKQQEQFRLAKIAYSHPLPVHIRRGEIVQDPQGRVREMLRLFTPGKLEMFGFVDQNVGTLLGPLLGNGWSGTGVTPTGSGPLYCEAEVVREGQVAPYNMRLRLLFFARPNHVDFIASTLESADPPRFLQHPAVYNPSHHHNYRYQNPHNTPAAGAQAGDAARRLARLRNALGGHGASFATGLDVHRAGKQPDVQRKQVEEVFHSLTSGIDLEQVEPPSMVSTKLYPHQKQALSFLLDREKEVEIPARDKKGSPTMVSLWKRVSDPYGRCIAWSNAVSDLQVSGERPPPQARGAILADDMGLGKTIVVISLVCTTIADAREWAKLPPIKEKHDARFDAPPNPKNGQTVPAAEFGSNMYGLTNADYAGAAPPKQTGRQKKAREKREKKREDAIEERFKMLECRSRATLIVCPLSTVQNWESQFEEHTRAVEVDDKGGKVFELSDDEEPKTLAEKFERQWRSQERGKDDSDDSDDEMMRCDWTPPPESRKAKAAATPRKKPLSIYVYHGTARVTDPAKLADHDVVITTFSTLASEYSKQAKIIEEREDAEEAAREAAEREREEARNGVQVIYGFGKNGELLTAPPGKGEDDDKKPKTKRKRKRVDGTGVSPLQAVQWYRVVLDEAHIIKEHRTIQARAACELSTSRRICLSGTPLQNNLNDIFSLIKFIRLEPFTDRAVWNQHIGMLIKSGEKNATGDSSIGENLGTERLKVIMRHLTLRRTKDTKDENGKPILALPPMDTKLIELEFNPTESAFYSSRHLRYKHEFAELEKTDSVGKNYCTILQELLKLRQICVHPALLQDSEDRSAAAGDLSTNIQKHGISKTRAIQLLALMADVGGGECAECGHVLVSLTNQAAEDEPDAEEDVKPKRPAKKARKNATSASTSTANNSEEEGAGSSEGPHTVVTKCQHVFCNECFKRKIATSWPHVTGEDMALCTVCSAELAPALDAVEIGAKELSRALERAVDQEVEDDKKSKGKKKVTRLFEHSTKTRALMLDLLPFSQANPYSPNYDPSAQTAAEAEGLTRTIGLQPQAGEIVKSVVFSQWTALLDRLGDALDAEHIVHRRLDGSMNREQRNDAMEAFKTDPKCEVLLVSLRAGGVGLNLTAGRRVYLMEPFWNPAVENQAVDRIYRLGQTMPVQTVRFIMKKSIEANMLKIQQRKMDLAKMSVGRTLSKAELAKQRREELGILLQ